MNWKPLKRRLIDLAMIYIAVLMALKAYNPSPREIVRLPSDTQATPVLIV